MATERGFGEADGRKVSLFTMTNGSGIRVALTNYGAAITELWTPDDSGRMADVALGFDTLEQYRASTVYFGCMVGRCANRIARGRFEIDGRAYRLAANNGPNHLHGGVKGFDKVVWEARDFAGGDGEGVQFRYRSPDGEEGYPGNLDVTVEYVLTESNELRITTEAETDAPTVVNLANHCYWNLAGHDAGTIHDHELTLHAERYTPVDSTFIPTGELAPVAGTLYDFRTPTAIGARIEDLPPVGPTDPGGYDHNYVLDGEPGLVRLAALLRDPVSGRTMRIRTDQPGVQFYTGNYLDGVAGKGRAVYAKRAGLCLETQIFPDAVNRRGRPGWPDPVLRPGQRYRHVMIHAFGAG